jgi:hypothetical protein
MPSFPAVVVIPGPDVLRDSAPLWPVNLHHKPGLLILYRARGSGFYTSTHLVLPLRLSFLCFVRVWLVFWDIHCGRKSNSIMLLDARRYSRIHGASYNMRL